ncbi:MAG TPA: hypothetical protein VJT68_05085 [Thermoleophilaceae bacterium]|nr:hypothetical protein [Thermoleophilaceae bacterium]
MRLITLTTALLAALAVVPATAGASARQFALFQDEALITQNGATRGPTLDEVKGLGADMIKVQVNWDVVAPGGKRKPKGFDGRDPSQYPGWARYDETIAAIKARGLKVMFALAPPAPGWATAKRGDSAGIYRPSAREFGRFAQAAARRYPGVDVWTIWNEANHADHLQPQATRSGRLVAPHIYKAMVRAAVRGLRRGGATHDPILFGELMPIGLPVRGPRRNSKPIAFLRSFFQGKPISGLGGLAYHPYTRPAGPLNPEPTSDDATIRSLPRLVRALDHARASGKLRSKKKLPIWITEFGFQTKPPDPDFGSPIARVPTFWSLSELWFAYSNRRVRAMSQYQMDDQPGSSALWQSGLRFANGAPKSNIYANYRLPILVRQLGPGAVEVRGAARPGGSGSTVQIYQRGRKGPFKPLGGPIGVRNVRGYFVFRARIRKARFRTFYFTAGGQSSLQVKAVRIF